MPSRAVPLATLLVLLAAPAWAHAILMASQPAAGGTTPPGPTHLLLRFNSRVDHARSSLVLTRPGGGTERLPIDGASAVDALSAAATLPPGGYNVRWQVLAVDGHITRGDVPFTVTAPDAASPQLASPQPGSSQPAAAQQVAAHPASGG